MKEYNIPERKFVDGPKKMVSWRMPEKLMKRLDEVAREKGWTTTDLVTTILDQYLQEENSRSEPKI